VDSKITILYVEDESSIRDSLVPILKFFSKELYLGVDGEDGLEKFKEHKPDLVISDIKMPKMNGIDMVKAIKEIDKKQHILFTTAHSENSFFMDAIDSHVDGYILKPIDLDILEEKILEITEQINLKKNYEKQQVIIQEISTLQNNLLLVLDSSLKVIFMNNRSLGFFDVADIEQFNAKFFSLNNSFIKDNDFFYVDDNECWVDKLLSLQDEQKLVSMIDKTDNQIKYFLVSLKVVENTSHVIVGFSEVTQLALERKDFEHRAFTDELTKVYNRAYFNEAMKTQVARYLREKISLSFLIFDIDKFKVFNDTYGHQMGDKILQTLALIVKKSTRETDTFARWGGEEFAVILPNTTLSDAMNVAEYLRKKIEENIFTDDLRVSCSFGVSEFRALDDTKSFVQRADDALYRAKENGRNRVEMEEQK